MSTEFRLYDVKEEERFCNLSREDKEKILPELVEYALKYGNKPTARKYNTYPSNVRNWVRKYQEYGIDGLKYNRNNKANNN